MYGLHERKIIKVIIGFIYAHFMSKTNFKRPKLAFRRYRIQRRILFSVKSSKVLAVHWNFIKAVHCVAQYKAKQGSINDFLSKSID